jgi:NitT/TauT family transport system ATP-binding protein
VAALVTMREVAFTYQHGNDGKPIFADVNLTLEAGEFVAAVGASGAGKSTLLRLLAQLLEPSRGEIKVLTETSTKRRPTALVFQDARLMPWRRVLGNVEFGLEGLAIARDERRGRARHALDLVGLGDYGTRWPQQLSGGQRQRVGLARALAVEPDLLLMDEPFGALDAITRSGLQDELITLWQRTHKTILFVTHDIDEAVYLADRVIVLAGTPAHICAAVRIATPRPRDRSSRELRAPAQTIRAALDSAGQALEAPSAPPIPEAASWTRS